MYKYLIFFLSVVSTVRCDLNKKEGEACEWKGVNGTCVNETRCLTSLDTGDEIPPVCSTKGETKIICCTDCELVSHTSNAVFSPRGGVLWKDGTKAKDNCIDYVDKLHHYRCRDGGFHGGMARKFDEWKKCHKPYIWAVGVQLPGDYEYGPGYPYQALIGFDSKGNVTWNAGGSIISDRFILTAAHINNVYSASGDLKHVVMGEVSSDPSTRQKKKVKRFIPHPDFKYPSLYHDIALIEVDTPIEFNKYVLPACLYTETTYFDELRTTTWRDLSGGAEVSDHVQEKILIGTSNKECKKIYPKGGKLEQGFNKTTQMCYGTSFAPSDTCQGFPGDPLLAIEEYADCVHSIIGVTSIGATECGSTYASPNIRVYTKTSYYIPWIESVVWP